MRSCRATLFVATAIGCAAPRPPIAPVSPVASHPKEADVPRASGAPTIIALALGHYRACALRSDGHVLCWGRLLTPLEKGIEPPTKPTMIADLDDAIAVAGDDGEWCALRRGGQVTCWAGVEAPHVLPLTEVVELVPGCARHRDGTVSCWSSGETPQQVRGVREAVRISGGFGGARCALLSDHTARCWGPNQWHQVGDSTTIDREVAVRATVGDGVDEISGSLFAGTCARLAGRVACWGGEGRGPARRFIDGVTDAAQISVAEYHACARTRDGGVMCWGANDSGQLGPANTTGAAERVPGVRGVVDVAVAGGEPCGGCGSTCVLTRRPDGGEHDRAEVMCWGALVERATPTRVDLIP